jgi:hypothetical protein
MFSYVFNCFVLIYVQYSCLKGAAVLPVMLLRTRWNRGWLRVPEDLTLAYVFRDPQLHQQHNSQ